MITMQPAQHPSVNCQELTPLPDDNRISKETHYLSPDSEEDETYTYNDLNQLTELTVTGGESSRTVNYTYDLNGNRISRTEGTAERTYSYDYEQRLLTVTDATLPADYDYTYDHRTRRVVIDATPVSGSASTTTLSFSGGTSVQEHVDSTLSVEFIRGSDMGGGIGGILYSLRSGAASFTHYNSRGDVVAKTDAGNTLTYQAAYEAYGTRSEEAGATLDPQKANTKDEDPTGLLNEGFRYRDLETGEFITRDPIGFKDGPNLYTYVRQNPWTRLDPEGLATDVGADGKFHPEAKLYRVEYDPNSPLKPKTTLVKSARDINAKNATIFINGMDTDLPHAAIYGLNHTGKRSFYLVDNPSEGGLKDFVKEAIPERLGAHLAVDKTAKELLKKFDLTTASVFAHSQGAMIANHAIEDLTHEGVRTAGMKLYYDGSAANINATKNIAKAAGATLNRFEGNPMDAVHNIVGLNTLNPLRIVGSILSAPMLFGNDPSWSPHTLRGGGAHFQGFNQVPFLR